MIGKQIKGRSFRGVLNYLEQSEGAEIIAGNMSGRNAIELSKEFRLSRQLNPEVERAVYHASLSLAPGEHLDNCSDPRTRKPRPENKAILRPDYLRIKGVLDPHYLRIDPDYLRTAQKQAVGPTLFENKRGTCFQ